jgi:hypothetical protein
MGSAPPTRTVVTDRPQAPANEQARPFGVPTALTAATGIRAAARHSAEKSPGFAPALYSAALARNRTRAHRSRSSSGVVSVHSQRDASHCRSSGLNHKATRPRLASRLGSVGSCGLGMPRAYANARRRRLIWVYGSRTRKRLPATCSMTTRRRRVAGATGRLGRSDRRHALVPRLHRRPSPGSADGQSRPKPVSQTGRAPGSPGGRDHRGARDLQHHQ